MVHTREIHLGVATVAILARKHSLLGKIDRLMEEAGIPHTYIGKTTALTNSEPFRRFHAFLKLAVNPVRQFQLSFSSETSSAYRRRSMGRSGWKRHRRGKVIFRFSANQLCVEMPMRYHDVPLSEYAEFLNAKFPDLSPESWPLSRSGPADTLTTSPPTSTGSPRSMSRTRSRAKRRKASPWRPFTPPKVLNGPS